MEMSDKKRFSLKYGTFDGKTATVSLVDGVFPKLILIGGEPYKMMMRSSGSHYQYYGHACYSPSTVPVVTADEELNEDPSP